MSNSYEDEARAALFEAFTAGWQAGLAVTITNPRVLAVVESCFDMWLLEASDEVEVLGLRFRRADLPGPGHEVELPGRRTVAAAAASIPPQRRLSEGVDGGLAASRAQESRSSAGGRDLRRLLTRSVARVGKHRHTGVGD